MTTCLVCNKLAVTSSKVKLFLLGRNPPGLVEKSDLNIPDKQHKFLVFFLTLSSFLANLLRIKKSLNRSDGLNQYALPNLTSLNYS